jgi:hypothetical protein
VPRLRTKPLFDEEFQLSRDSTRPAAGFGSVNVLMPPGRYTVRLTVNGTQYTQPLTVLKDPHDGATLADIHEQFVALSAIQRDHRAAADMLETIERVRAKLQAVPATDAAVKSAGDSLEKKFIAVEWRIVDPRLTGRGQDEVRWPVRLGGQLSYLASGIDDSDFRPTQQQRDVAAVLAKETRDVRAALDVLLSRDLTAFNQALRTKGMATIDVQPVP